MLNFRSPLLPYSTYRLAETNKHSVRGTYTDKVDTLSAHLCRSHLLYKTMIPLRCLEVQAGRQSLPSHLPLWSLQTLSDTLTLRVHLLIPSVWMEAAADSDLWGGAARPVVLLCWNWVRALPGLGWVGLSAGEEQAAGNGS